MIKRITQLMAALALCLAAATPALADGMYVGASVVSFDQSVTVPGASDSGNSAGFMIQLGSDFNEYLAMEIRLGDTNTAHFSRIAASQRATLSSFLLRGKLPLNDNLRMYGVLGLTTGEATPSGSLTGYAKRDSMSYGAGLQVHGVHWRGSIEWMRYWDKVNVGPGIDVTIDGIAATVGYAF